MTPKEKAKELIERFLNKFPSGDDIGFGQPIIAKQCALVCVDDELRLLEKFNNFNTPNISKEILYLREVKQEINNL